MSSAQYEYKNFDLLLKHNQKENHYRAHVTDSPGGDGEDEFSIPFTMDELAKFYQSTGRVYRTLDGPVPVPSNANALSPEEFGTRLFKAVFAGTVRNRFVVSISKVQEAKNIHGLRIRLRFDSDVPELIDFPWEYLYDPYEKRFLSLSTLTPIVRYIERPWNEPELWVSSLRILVILANPNDQEELRVEEEWNRLNDATIELQKQGRIVVECIKCATYADFKERLSKGDVNILHFIGHGVFDAKTNEGSLAFVKYDTGGTDLVPAEDLAMQLHEYNKELRLVFLNACEGAKSGQTDPFAGIAQRLVQQGLPAVIAMQSKVTDRSAIALAQEFYKYLTQLYPVDTALVKARQAIYELKDKAEWGLPVLYMRSPDGYPFGKDLPLPPPIISVQFAKDPPPPSPITPIQFEWIHIPASTFFINTNPPQQTIYVPGYFIAKVPVTNEQYKQFVEETGYRIPEHWQKNIFTSRIHVPLGQEQHPVVNVSWYDVQEFCTWAGVSLPKEEEWIKAARGDKDDRLYPWGNQAPNQIRCNFNNAIGETTPVDKYPEGRSSYGCLDMAGNVWEIASRPDENKLCIMYGGSFNSSAENVRCVSSDHDNAAYFFDNVGFRVTSPVS